jgi:beta-galactosidase
VNTALKRRLNRALHAFSPATPALFAVLGSGSRETCYEDDFGLGGTVASEVDAFIEAFEQALSARGVPFAHADGETAEPSLAGARWIICPTAGGVDPELWKALRRFHRTGARVTIGPRVPARDGALRPLPEPLDASGFELVPMTGPHPHVDPTFVSACVDTAIRELELPELTVAPTGASENARFTLRRRAMLTDLLDESRYECRDDGATVFLPARTVRMLRIDLT